jgi:hypothetical protein
LQKHLPKSLRRKPRLKNLWQKPRPKSLRWKPQQKKLPKPSIF